MSRTARDRRLCKNVLLRAAQAACLAATLIAGLARPAAAQTLPKAVPTAPSAKAAPSAAAAAVPAPAAAAAQAVTEALDERFLDALRQRHLFDLAEKFCSDRLARSDLPDAKRATLTIELARSQLEEALEAAPEARDPLWRAALDTVDNFVQKNPKNARAVQVRVERGLIELARGEQLAAEAEVTGRNEQRLNEARDHLRTAIDDLRGAGEQAGDMLRRQQMGRKAEPGELSAQALRSLTRNVQYQLARALVSQGTSYPIESADRTNSLAQAVEILRPFADPEADPTDPLVWPARVDSAAAYRRLGHLEAAGRKLDLIDEASPPAAIAQRARAERIRLALAEQQVDAALTLASKERGGEGQGSAELDYAVLEAYLAGWQAAADKGQKPQAAALQSKAAEAVRALGAKYGAYWQRRAEAAFAEQVADNPGTTDADALARAAEGFYRAGQIDEALAVYDRAAAQAREAEQTAKCFEMAFAAAALEQQREHHAAAAERFRQAALAAPKLPKAAEAHLMAIYDAGQAARAGTANAMDQYIKLLEEHVATFPAAATLPRARVWLARVYEREHKWKSAVEEYTAVGAGNNESAEAAAGLARSYLAMLDEMAAAEPTARAAEQAVAALEAAATLKGAATSKLSAEQLQITATVAQILLNYSSDGAGKAERMLNDALAQATNATDEWKASAHALLVYAAAVQGRTAEAEQQLAQLAGAGPMALEGLVEQLDRLCGAAQPAQKKQLAALELRAIEMIAKSNDAAVNDEQRRKMALAHARAMVAAGRVEEATAEFERLAADNPRDGRIQEALAVALTTANEPGALAAWQRVERRSRSGSERWMRAKLQEALIYERRNDPGHAIATVQAVKTLYPEMGGEALAREFLAVLKRCGQKSDER